MKENCQPGAAWYVASPAGELSLVFGCVLRDLELFKHTLVWAKDAFVMGRADYHYQHEPIFYGWVPGGSHYFCERRDLGSILKANRPHKSKEHPTMKPVELVRGCIENSTRAGWIVADGFGGSGTTLLAAAESQRVARLVEFEPRYCDVIRKRWTAWARKAGVPEGSGALEP